MRRFGLAFAMFVSLLLPISNAEAVAPKPGAKCSKAGNIQVSKGLRFTCVKKSKKLVWNNGVRVRRATPTPSVTATPSPSPTPTVAPSPSPSPTPTVAPSPSPSPTPTVAPSPSPSPTPTVAPSPSPSPTPTVAPSPSPTPTSQNTGLQLIPNLRLKSFDLKRCEVEILNFDNTYEWVIRSDFGSVTRLNNLVTLITDNEFPTVSLVVIARKLNASDGETTVNCVPI